MGGWNDSFGESLVQAFAAPLPPGSRVEVSVQRCVRISVERGRSSPPQLEAVSGGAEWRAAAVPAGTRTNSVIQLQSADLELLALPPPRDLRALPQLPSALPPKPLVAAKPKRRALVPPPLLSVARPIAPCAKTEEFDVVAGVSSAPPSAPAGSLPNGIGIAPGRVERGIRQRWLALLLSSLVLLFVVGVALSRVSVTVKAPGALRAPNGVRSVSSVLSGALTDVFVHAGDAVEQGQLLARLEETQLRATLTRREHELADIERETRETARADAALLAAATAALEHQKIALARRSSIHEAQLRQRAQRLNDVRRTSRDSVPNPVEALAVHESVQAAAESAAVVGGQTGELELVLADRKREWKQRELERSWALSRAVAAAEEARSGLALAELRAPISGRVEVLLAKPGMLLQPGALLVQIVPRGVPRSIVAFVSAREASLVHVGSEANVELEALPKDEGGTVRARVERVSAEVVTAQEIALVRGESLSGSFVRVELSVLDEPLPELAPYLRSGERATVRVQRPEQRIVSLMLEFVKRRLEG